MRKKPAMRKVALLTAAAMLLLVPGPARADAESPALAKYRTRVDLAVQKALAVMATRQEPNGSFEATWQVREQRR